MGWVVWKAQGGKFTEKCCIILGSSEADYGLAYVVLITVKYFSQIAIILAMTRTRIDSLNNNVKTVLCVEHRAVLLRRSSTTNYRLNRIWLNA